MTKIPPFGCDVRNASAEQKREFLELLRQVDGRNWRGYLPYYGIRMDGKSDGRDNELNIALEAFTRLIPIEEGIKLLKGEDDEPVNDGWISVKDRLPEVGKDYLVTDGIACMVCAYRSQKKDWDFWSVTWWSNEQVTHWMPLPNPPKQ